MSSNDGRVRRQRCRRAEKALDLAVERAGEMVPGEALSDAWPDAVPDAELPSKLADGRWGEALKPAVDEGRVRRVRQWRRVYYAPASRPELRPPPKTKAERNYGPAAIARCAGAEAALKVAVETHKRMVSVGEICAAWAHVHGEEAPGVVAGRAKRTFGPALQEGTVRVESVNGTNYFAPADQPDLSPPRFPSDLMRTEEALWRAVEKLDSTVLISAVKLEIGADTELTLASDLSIAHHLASLVETGRAAAIPSRRGPYGSQYYSTPDGPRHIRAEAEHHLDKRLRAAELCWKYMGGRPFTTKALRRYAEERPSLQFPDDPVYGWTNGLQHLEKHGQLTKITTGENRPDRWVQGPERFVRWAPTEEWLALNKEERERLVREGWGAARAFDEDAATDPHDPGYLSQAHNLRQLVSLAQRMEAEEFEDHESQVIVAARPVPVEPVQRAAEARPDLAPEDTEVAPALREAARVREGVRVPAVWRAGRLPGNIYFAPEESGAASAYVDFLKHKRRANPDALERALEELRECMELDVARLLPLPNAVGASRAHQICKEAERSAAQLRDAAEQTELLQKEKEALQLQLDRLKVIAARAHEVAEKYDHEHDLEPLDDKQGIDTVRAWREIEGLAPYQMETPRLLIGRFKYAVETIPAPEGQLDVQGPRPVERQLDRIGFACYAGLRWGGPTLAAFSAKAQDVIGDLRDPAPFIAALAGADFADHAPAAAALGIFDDEDSREALVEFLDRAVHSESAVSASPAAAVLAAYALAPLPFGAVTASLAPAARRILQELSAAETVSAASTIAARVLCAWEENWPRPRLLQL